MSANWAVCFYCKKESSCLPC